MARITAILLALMLLVPPALAQPSLPESIAVGQPFPVLNLPTLDGGRGSLADYRGEKVVLHVFASW